MANGLCTAQGSAAASSLQHRPHPRMQLQSPASCCFLAAARLMVVYQVPPLSPRPPGSCAYGTIVHANRASSALHRCNPTSPRALICVASVANGSGTRFPRVATFLAAVKTFEDCSMRQACNDGYAAGPSQSGQQKQVTITSRSGSVCTLQTHCSLARHIDSTSVWRPGVVGLRAYAIFNRCGAPDCFDFMMSSLSLSVAGFAKVVHLSTPARAA